MTRLKRQRLALSVAATVSAVTCALFVVSSASAAAPITVCPAGSVPACAYTTIQNAIDVAPDNATILVGPGAYAGALDIKHSVTLEGDGPANTIITAPASLSTSFTTSGPNDPIVYADAASVTIKNLTVDGQNEGNPALNYRFEGIASYNDNVTVDNVTVMGIADNPLDGDQTGTGIYAVADDGNPHTITITNSRVYGSNKNGIVANGDAQVTVDVTGNIVVAAGGSPIGSNGIEIYNDFWAANGVGPSGTVSGNVVSGNVCNLAQPTCGTDLLSDGYLGGNNDVNGDSAGILLGNVAALTVSGNTVTDSDIGVWSTTAPGSTAKITGNTIEDNLYADVLAEFGPVAITANTIAGGTDSTGTLAGVLVANYNGDPSSSAPTITANTISGTADGVEVAQGETPGAPLPSATISHNAISGNSTGIENLTAATVAAAENWFGCNAGPGSTGCDTISGPGAGHVTSAPHLVLAVTASPSSVTVGQTSSVTAGLAQDSSGATLTGAFPSGLPVAFVASAGSVGPTGTLDDGSTSTTLSGTPVGTATVTATVNGQPVSATINTSAVSSGQSVPGGTPPALTLAPRLAFLPSGSLSLLVRHPGSALTVFCVDGCSATVTGQIVVTLAHHKHETLMLNQTQLTVAAGGASVYTLVLTSFERTVIKHAVKSVLTLSVAAKDTVTGKTTTGQQSFAVKIT